MRSSAPARDAAPPRNDVPHDQSIVLAGLGERSQGLARRASKGFRNWLKGAVLVLGVMYVIPWFVLSFSVAAISSMVFRPTQVATTAERNLTADLARPYGIAPDPRITPEQAGIAFNALQPVGRKGGDFKFRQVANRPEAPWRTWQLEPALFSYARPSGWDGPNSLEVLAAAKKGFSPKEKEVLQAIAAAPVWRDYETFAKAPAADLIGGRFELPFSADASVFNMPIARFTATKELAYASVSRAAWHLSEGRRDSAEFVLRTTISFGQAMTDNATFLIDQLIGNAVTGIGRTALGQFYTITGDPRAAAVSAIGKTIGNPGKPGNLAASVPRELQEIQAGTLDERRQRLISIATTPAYSRAIRQSALMDLALSSCTKVGELLTGPNTSARTAFTQARRDLARTPGEAATLDLIENSLSRYPARMTNGFEDAAQFVGRLYFNPRLSTCALLIGSGGQALR